MAEFNYVALSRNGGRETGTIQAASLEAAGHMLKEQGLLPTTIEPKDTHSIFDSLKKVSTVSLSEKIGVVENLGIMLKAGIPISRSLQIIVRQMKNPRMKEVMGDIYNQVQSGKGLAEAIAAYPKIFSNIFVSMIRVGDMSGNLEKSLEYLSVQLHREADLKSKVKGAMIYPSVIISAMLIIGVLMSIFVLPNLTSVFKDFAADLPPTTKFIMAFADFMSGNATLVIGVMIGLIAAVIAFLKTPPGQRFFDNLLLRFFLINTIVKKINLARFARVLSSLLKSGIPIVSALEVAGESIANIPYRELVLQSAKDVKFGKTLAATLGKNERLFPPLVVQMLEVGEESGTVEEILGQLAEHYEEEVDSVLGNMSSIIEPLLLLTIGGVVGFLAVGLIAPIYNIGSNIK
ncbi:MAG: type II secretion system F family protein [Patescibacteria group bacterium]|nr:type II secretion system F family protein [Patescibacteria group bacterium]